MTLVLVTGSIRTFTHEALATTRPPTAAWNPCHAADSASLSRNNPSATAVMPANTDLQSSNIPDKIQGAVGRPMSGTERPLRRLTEALVATRANKVGR